ncbi:MAG TPA: nitrilase, partial [Clostridiaceae bacterium]|nr:nitrilase [Clostridiaceae bacterium]
VQQNLFFGVESGFKGRVFDSDFYSRSIIHGPLEMTNRENGFIKFESNNYSDNIITAELDNEKRKEAVKKFDTLRSLNTDLYKDIFR